MNSYLRDLHSSQNTTISGAAQPVPTISLPASMTPRATPPTKLRIPLAVALTVLLLALSSCKGGNGSTGVPGVVPIQRAEEDGAYHVHPGEEIQPALELAAKNPIHKTVKVHAGTYRPRRHGQALIWFNARHNGITLEAVGEVVLTAANTAIADPSLASYPAVVNHVVYFGDRISRRTVLRGFKITGANGFVTRSEYPEPIQPEIKNRRLRKRDWFYQEGGGIKIFGRSYPIIENVEVYENYASPCGGGVSVEHRGYTSQSVLFRNSIFRDNSAQIGGSGMDVLDGSAVTLENTLFVGNLSNAGPDDVGFPHEYNRIHGTGALTVFHNTSVKVSHSTFTGNWNGVDDHSSDSTYVESIFWQNDLTGGTSPGDRFELDIINGHGMNRNFIGGHINDPQRTVNRRRNYVGAPDPEFDASYRPQSEVYDRIGYRPAAGQ